MSIRAPLIRELEIIPMLIAVLKIPMVEPIRRFLPSIVVIAEIAGIIRPLPTAIISCVARRLNHEFVMGIRKYPTEVRILPAIMIFTLLYESAKIPKGLCRRPLES